MGTFNTRKEYYTEDPSGHNESKKSLINIEYSSVYDAGTIVIKDEYGKNYEIHLDEDGLNILMDVLLYEVNLRLKRGAL